MIHQHVVLASKGDEVVKEAKRGEEEKGEGGPETSKVKKIRGVTAAKKLQPE